MIPLAAIPWRLIGYGSAVAAVALMGWRVSVWHESHGKLQAAENALEAERECREGTVCAKRAAELTQKAETTRQEVVASYEQELASVRSERPVRVVRVCADPGNVPGSGTPGAADGSTAPGGVVSGPPRPDIGPDLYALAREADEVAARLRALQEWNAALSNSLPDKPAE